MSIKKDVFGNNDENNKNVSSDRSTNGPGRPTKHDEPTENLTVVFTQSRFIDIRRICFHILEKTNNKLPMTALIRGISEAVLDSDINLEEAENEQEVFELVSRAIQ